MKRLLMVLLMLVMVLSSGCTYAPKHDHPPVCQDLVINGILYVVYPGADEVQKAAMDAYVDEFRKAYPKVTVFVDYPEEFTEEDLLSRDPYSSDIILVPEDLVGHYVEEGNLLMSVDAYCRPFGFSADDIYNAEGGKGKVGGRLYCVFQPQFSGADGGSADGAGTDNGDSGANVKSGFAVFNRTHNPDAAAAFVLFYYTPEVPEGGVWPYTSPATIID
ncbi:MAG: hypothetical protein J5950_04305 [Clostridia bacterium]|nr:hypothetical protein [Clostridia bacterium]